MNLESEGEYLDEKCRTNPSRYLPGPKAPVKKSKMRILGFRGLGFWGLGGFGVLINSRSTTLSGLCVIYNHLQLAVVRIIAVHLSPSTCPYRAVSGDLRLGLT